MTVAALEASALRKCLAEANGDLGQQFFAAAAEVVGPLWASNQFNDPPTKARFFAKTEAGSGDGCAR
jgi:hypothetical protein